MQMGVSAGTKHQEPFRIVCWCVNIILHLRFHSSVYTGLAVRGNQKVYVMNR